ncbi:DUF982 domain-containing protein [Rhizobium sp. ARZ01]|uniref:DUF982 domain-containing protein n=1 Tax=Rhizobium sp. ARZ01 TaxID=2769313 RepID=UPI001FEE1300|nr:DUF982 domain-containing protein [Rhizobium sp. ARZ01]
MYWTRSVELDLSGPGRVQKVRSTLEAVECLRLWPNKQGDAFAEAKRVCRAVLMNGAPRGVAREAFIRAADEAGIYIRKR